MSPAPQRLPPTLAALLEGAALARVLDGESGDEVVHATLPDGGVRYLKVAHGWRRAELRHEHAVLRWLDGRAGAPIPLHYEENQHRGWLLLPQVPGVPASDLAPSVEPRALAKAAAQALAGVHALPVNGCPFPRAVADMVHEAWRRARAGLVDLARLDEERRHWSADQLLAELEATAPTSEDLVFVHGDFCLPNILLLQPGAARRRHGSSAGTPVRGAPRGKLQLGGLVDWGRAGVADRYQDIALLLRSFDRNAAPAARAAFARAYGLDALDEAKLSFYQLLDEFF